MSKRYCFRIINIGNKKFDEKKLKDFITELYIDNFEDKDKDKLSLSFIPYYSRGIEGENVCIQMTSNSKHTIGKIEEINKMLGQNPSKLKWIDGIFLSEPYEFDDTQHQDFQLKLKETKGKKKWSSIIQRGPYFKEIMEPYRPLDAILSINKDGRKITYNLTPEEEKVAGFYAKRIIADNKPGVTNVYTKLETFNKNFWNDFENIYLTKKAKSIFKSYEDFKKIDWSDLINKIEQRTADDKKIDKRINKQKLAQIKSEYGYAILDGKPRQKIGNYNVEMSGIFLGKKGHKLLGRIKKEIKPKDVIINIGEDDTEPVPPKGHKWGGIAHDHTRVWLASWKDEINNKNKYIWFSSEGVFKAQSDFNKYEKARKLHSEIQTIRDKYMLKSKSSNDKNKQIGTVLYLIDHFGIRIGNEIEADTADTVGATTLLVSNIKLVKKNIKGTEYFFVIFDFEGKDSIRFYKELEVPENIFKNFEDLTTKKKNDDKIFHKITSDDVNEYIKEEFDPSFSAKVFRTRLASEIMYNALEDLDDIPPKSTKTYIKNQFNKANIKVAEVLNHVRTVGKSKAIEKLEQSLKEATEKGDTKKIKKLNEDIASKQDLLAVAINTSLSNYIDPRIVASWAKTQNIAIDSVYNSTLKAKFKWAINFIDDNDNWSWKDSELEEGGEGEEEGEEGEEEEEEKPKRSRTRRSVQKEREKKSHTLIHPPKTETLTRRRPPPPTIETPTPTPTSTPPFLSRRTPKIETLTRRRPPPPTTETPTPTPTSTPPFLSRRTPKIDKSEESPEMLESYQLLLELCENLKSGKNKKNNYKLISKIDEKVLKWVYPLSKEILKIIDNNNIYYKPNKYIIDYCNKEIFNSSPSPPFPIPPSFEPLFTPTPPRDLRVGDSVLRRGELCTVIQIDRSMVPFGVTVKNIKSGKIIDTELSFLSFPEESTPPLFTPTPSPTPSPTPLSEPPSTPPRDLQVGDSVLRRGELCTVIEIDRSMVPFGVTVRNKKSGNIIETELSFLSFPEESTPPSRTPLFTPTRSPTPSPTPPPLSPKKPKAKPKEPKKKIKRKKITEERFRYINSYNQDDLKEYCKSYGIDTKGKNINELQENIMKFFEFNPKPPWIPKKENLL